MLTVLGSESWPDDSEGLWNNKCATERSISFVSVSISNKLLLYQPKTNIIQKFKLFQLHAWILVNLGGFLKCIENGTRDKSRNRSHTCFLLQTWRLHWYLFHPHNYRSSLLGYYALVQHCAPDGTNCPLCITLFSNPTKTKCSALASNTIQYLSVLCTFRNLS